MVTLTLEDVLSRLKAYGNPILVEEMKRVGISSSQNNYGIHIPILRKLAKEIGQNHELAVALWASGSREARVLASLIENPQSVKEKQIEQWVSTFDGWEICDQCCQNLIRKTQFAYTKSKSWAERPEEYIRRAGFSLMAGLAVEDKLADDAVFETFFPFIERGAEDARYYVKKAVSWALRQIGKRDLFLNRGAVQLAQKLTTKESAAARWVGSDAKKELLSEDVQRRLREK